MTICIDQLINIDDVALIQDSLGNFTLTSLDICDHKSPFYLQKSTPLERRKKRLYQRCMSGIEIAWGNSEKIRFLTLTSRPKQIGEKTDYKNGIPPPERSDSYESPEIHPSFIKLVKRIRRKFGVFEYVAVKELTISGLEHLHVIFRGEYIPLDWIRENWSDIHHGAYEVNIKILEGDKKHIGGYLMKYLGKDSKNRYRFWCSQKWCFKGFVGFWKKVVSEYKGSAVRTWTYFLNGGVIRFSYRNWSTWDKYYYEYWKIDRGKPLKLVSNLGMFGYT